MSYVFAISSSVSSAPGSGSTKIRGNPAFLAYSNSFLIFAGSLGMDALVEVHDEAELERALAVGAALIGVNQRDLVTFEVDTERAVRLAGRFPPGVLAVAESGIDGPAAAANLATAGFHAVLVGETLMRSSDRAAAVAALRSCAALRS